MRGVANDMIGIRAGFLSRVRFVLCGCGSVRKGRMDGGGCIIEIECGLEWLY